MIRSVQSNLKILLESNIIGGSGSPLLFPTVQNVLYSPQDMLEDGMHPIIILNFKSFESYIDMGTTDTNDTNDYWVAQYDLQIHTINTDSYDAALQDLQDILYNGNNKTGIVKFFKVNKRISCVDSTTSGYPFPYAAMSIDAIPAYPAYNKHSGSFAAVARTTLTITGPLL